jgi:hypothetical protein
VLTGILRANGSPIGEQAGRVINRIRKGTNMAKRTTHRSTAGKKLYAKRDAAGKFEDIQTYERAHGQDLKKKSKAEKGKAKRSK